MDQARARATDPATSHEAAAKVRVSKRERQILTWLSMVPDGMTASSIAFKLNVGRDSVSPRMKGLVAKEFVIAAGESSGQTIWRATIKGVEALG